jgi:hypothetical protein
MQELPRSAWPDAIQRLTPEKVFLEKDGVSIQVYSRFVEASGLYVTFEGAEAPAQGGGDPSFDPLWDRIYWYQIVG